MKGAKGTPPSPSSGQWPTRTSAPAPALLVNSATSRDFPMLIDLYMSGKYKLDELISRRLPLSELNEGFDLMLQGEVKRSVIVY